MSWGFAGCPDCKEPLVCTLHFRNYEFICIECGRKFAYLEPTSLGDSEEMKARSEELQAEWDEHTKGKLIVEGREQYAAESQLQAHEEALAWLRQRAAA